MDSGRSFGYLEVTVLSGIIISPIMGATVNIYGEDNDSTYLIQSGVTNNAGFAGPFRLSSYDEDYNDPDIGIRPVKKYVIEIEASGYYRKVKNGIPIFPDIVSQEYANMLPLPDEDGKFTLNFPETLFEESETRSGTEGGDENG